MVLLRFAQPLGGLNDRLFDEQRHNPDGDAFSDLHLLVDLTAQIFLGQFLLQRLSDLPYDALQVAAGGNRICTRSPR